MGMYKIHWATAIYNFPSMKLAEKLGFHFEKLLPQAIQLKTGPRDAVVYCLEV
jgi:RimJ/RimL family protein N-acetyltransferase